MYAIANIVWGSPINEAASKIIANIDDPSEVGVTILYSGSASIFVGYVGVCLGSIDECAYVTSLDLAKGEIKSDKNTIRLFPTADQKREAQELYDRVPDNLRSVLPPIGLYIVWSSS